jgi:hypothetical protein
MDAYKKATADQITTVLGNTPELYEAIWELVCEHLRYSCGYPDMDPEQYRQMLAREGESGVANEIKGEISMFVHKEVEKLGITASGGLPGLIIDLFDFDDSGLWTEVAEVFVPGIRTYADTTGQEWT